ncbi:MAG: DNA polymerase III subunit epsilon [Rhodocyclaceae bacterium]|uniref:DNA polymerase III subunit epsilon n=1 Tax=Candidatus Desulfobacillus denitrificans TaxID=2608985 RepID=A0A809R061_9PROT|nr:DNA polymerase III subunit epsilon [Rhodocyclaceae bacterium]BBO21030.1 DNA polymerase III subunit epsilon [Candidatus Desulfobacillus denitrificans]GIK45296.1 MAG: DNA polymerase III subunit epsilon [Betaproteobacteria bacterium]GJQ53624.1 MAG: DNA polymerase III subunit epsilon [Rhodocyclaceae bacterium]
MRQVVLDTETTGLDFRLGDRVIEIGCVELLNRKITGQRFHRYINPEREVEAGALAVHGLSNEFLQDKPRFGEIVAEFLDFIQGAELVIHNAAFDVGFLNNELALQRKSQIEQACAGVVDTLKMARELHPGRRNSLDALCERYTIDNSGRTLHGALLDAELLAEVYLAMTRGQESLIMELVADPTQGLQAETAAEQPPLRILRASAAELTAHRQVLAEIGKESKGNCLWTAADGM